MRSKSELGEKEYHIFSAEEVQEQFSAAASSDGKVTWEAVFTYLPFASGGLFRISYEKMRKEKVHVNVTKRNFKSTIRTRNTSLTYFV